MFKTKKIVLIISAVIFCGVIALTLPISPGSDSFTLVNSLKYLLNGAGYTEWSTRYFNFWGNNKIALLVYLAFCRLFSWLGAVAAVEYGIRLTHFIMLAAFVFSMPLAFGKLFGFRFFSFSLVLSVLLYPFVILTAPYVYPLAITAAAVCFCAGLYRNNAARVVFFASFGFLFLLRPTAAVFIAVYHLVAFARSIAVKDNDAKKRFVFIAVMLLSIPVTKQTVGLIMYKTGTHPYPAMTSSSTLWTLYVGTNLNGGETGLIRYNVDAEPESDDLLAVTFHNLWELGSRAEPNDYVEVLALHSQAKTLLWQRIKETILDDLAHLVAFLRYKAQNLFFGESLPTFYQLNVTSSSFTKEAAANILGDSLSYNKLLVGLFIFSLVFLAVFGRKNTDILWVAIPSVLGALGSIAAFVLLTEVANRYLADIFPALYVVIISALIMFVREIEKLKKTAIKQFGRVFTVFVLFIAVFITYRSNDLDFWRDAESQFSISNGEASLSVIFKNEPPVGYGIRYGDSETPLSKHTKITFGLDGGLYFYNMDGGFYVASHDPINHERFIK